MPLQYQYCIGQVRQAAPMYASPVSSWDSSPAHAQLCQLCQPTLSTGTPTFLRRPATHLGDAFCFLQERTSLNVSRDRSKSACILSYGYVLVYLGTQYENRSASRTLGTSTRFRAQYKYVANVLDRVRTHYSTYCKIRTYSSIVISTPSTSKSTTSTIVVVSSSIQYK